MNAAEVKAALRERYPKPEWSIFFEVANGTGATVRRYADAVAMCLYPSRGLEINGFEIKVYRSDWIKELKNPAKAEDIFRYCDRWWLVTTPGVIAEGELPLTWGHIEAKDGKLRQIVAAPKLTPCALDRPFTAALIRRAGELDEDQRRLSIQKEVSHARTLEKDRADREIEHATRRYRELSEKVAEVEKLTGIDLSKWRPTDEIAQALRFAMSASLFGSYGRINSLRSEALALIRLIDEAQAAIAPASPPEEKSAA